MAEKQQKVLNKLNKMKEFGNKTPLGTKPNDECYTSMQDILNEMSYWAELGKFKDKNIICPCDWDIVEGEDIYSITITYKDADIDVAENTVKKINTNKIMVKYDLWGKKDTELFIQTIELKEDEIDNFLRDKLTCNFLRTFTQNARRWGIKSITASGYNPATGKGVRFQDVDYSKYDICCTNPPFSLYGEFMKCIVGKIDFIVLAPYLNRVSPNVGLYLMLNKAYLGKSAENGGTQGFISMYFANPTSKNEYKTKCVACDWLTSFDDAQIERNNRLENKTTGIDFEIYKDEFEEMENITMLDGTHPLRISAGQLPDNYDGWVFSSINILTKIDLRKYEWYGTGFSGYFHKNPDKSPFLGNKWSTIHNGKTMFHGIVFRKKPELK